VPAMRNAKNNFEGEGGRGSIGGVAVIKNSGDITTLLVNNCHFKNLIEGADSQAHERVCQFLGMRLEQLGYVLVHNSDLTPHTDTTTASEEKPDEAIPTTSTLTLLNISAPKETE
jgi:hypothetical protein